MTEEQPDWFPTTETQPQTIEADNIEEILDFTKVTLKEGARWLKWASDYLLLIFYSMNE
jgi:hypothetical protein